MGAFCEDSRCMAILLQRNWYKSEGEEGPIIHLTEIRFIDRYMIV